MVAGGADNWIGGVGTAAPAGWEAGAWLYVASTSDACPQSAADAVDQGVTQRCTWDQASQMAFLAMYMQNCHTFVGAVACKGLTISFLEVTVRPTGKPAATQSSQHASRNVLYIVCQHPNVSTTPAKGPAES